MWSSCKLTKQNDAIQHIRSVTKSYYEVDLSTGEAQKGKLTDQFITYYLTDGQIEALLDITSTGDTAHTRYAYDENALLLKKITNYSSSLSQVTRYSYDEHHNKKEEVYSNLNGNIYGRAIFAYNHKEELVSKKVYGSSSKLSMRYEYEYDRKGRMVLERRYKGNGDLWTLTTFNYNKQDKVIDVLETYSDGDFSSHYSYSYDELGREVSAHSFQQDGSYHWREFSTYHGADKFGNWLKKHIYENEDTEQSPFLIVERTFQYF